MNTDDDDEFAPIVRGIDHGIDSMLDHGRVINRLTYLAYIWPTPPEYWSSDLEECIPRCVREPAWELPWDIPIR